MTGQVSRISGCTLVDVVSGRAHGRMSLAWHGERIVAVSPAGSGPDPAAEVDGTGLYAVPGLIDMHVHMAADPEGLILAAKGSYTQPVMALLAARNLQVALQAGITTVRDLGTGGRVAFDVKRAWQCGLLSGARPVVAGPVITAVGGHGAELGLQARGPAMVRDFVRRNIEAGADVIKLVLASAARDIELSAEELAAGIDEAHACGRPVAVHANFSEESIAKAVRAGCDTLEHGYLLSPDVIGHMRASMITLCPTIAALRTVIDHADTFARRSGPELPAAATTHLARAEAAFRQALDMGIRIVAGTDAGVPFNHFDALHRELALMNSWGMSAAQALRAATCDAAAAMNRSDIGSLRPGAVADIVVVGANPADDIAALTDVRFVFQRGTLMVNAEPGRIRLAPSALPGSYP